MNKETWQAIKDKYPISSYLNDKGIDYQRKGRNLVLRCIIPGHNDTKPSFVVYEDTRYTCFACRSNPESREIAQGDIFDLASIIEQKPKIEVLYILAERAHIQLDPAETAVIKRRFEDSEKRREMANGFATNLANIPAWQNYALQTRGLDLRTVTYFGLGVDSASKCLAIPLRDHYARLVGFSIHHPKADPKYKNPTDGDIYAKSKFLFNSDSVKAGLLEKNILFLVEGYFDAMSCLQHGYPATVAYCGSMLTFQQVELIRTMVNSETRIVFIPDVDTTGLRAVQTNFETIRKVIKNPVFVCPLAGDKPDGSTFVAKDANDWFAVHGQTALPTPVNYFEYIVGFYISQYPDEYVQSIKIKEALKPASAFEKTKLVKRLAEHWSFSEQQVSSVLEASTSVSEVEYKDVDYWIDEYIQYVREIDKHRLSFGFKEMDDAVRGLNPGEIGAFMGRANTCKTLMSTDAVDKMIGAGKSQPTVIFSMEMTAVSLGERIITQFLRVRTADGSSPSKVIEKKVREGDPDTMEWLVKIRTAHRNVVIVDTPGLSIKDMDRLLNEIEASYFREPVKMIVVDHLQIIRSEGQTDYARTTNAAKDLREFTRRRKIGTLVLVQTSRKGGSGGEPLSMDDARDSGVIEEVMDFIFGVWRPELKIIQEMEKARSETFKADRKPLKDDSGKLMKDSTGSRRYETDAEAMDRSRSDKTSMMRMYSQMLVDVRGQVMVQVLKSRREGRNALFIYQIQGLNIEFVRRGDTEFSNSEDGSLKGESSGVEPEDLEGVVPN